MENLIGGGIMKISILILLAFINLTGCAYLGEHVADENTDKSMVVETYKYSYSIVTNYMLNDVKKSYVGSAMIKVEDFTVKNITRDIDLSNSSFTSAQDFEISGMFLRRKSPIESANNRDIITIKFDKNSIFNVIRKISYNNNLYYAVTNNNSEYIFLITTDGHFVSDKYLRKESDYYLFTDTNMKMIPKEIIFQVKQNETEKQQVLSKEFSIPEVNYELIYGGKDLTGLHIIYREYTKDGIARQAFFQNLNYEGNAKTIRFKNTNIEVISADNQKIVFKVLEDDIGSLEKAGNAALPKTSTIQREWSGHDEQSKSSRQLQVVR